MRISYTLFVENVDSFVLHESSNVTRYVDAELAPRARADAICVRQYYCARMSSLISSGEVDRYVQTNGTGTMKLVTPRVFA